MPSAETAVLQLFIEATNCSGVEAGIAFAYPTQTTFTAAPDGTLRAVLFGYSCHNTTLGGDFYQVDGDYAGMAQRELEQAHPGATALFMM